MIFTRTFGQTLATIRPPTMLTIRSAWSMSRWSWVTIRTVVRSGPSARRWSMAMTVSPDFLSRAAVGSSARTIAGRLTSARAIATRCRWPPESRDGRVMKPVAQAELAEQLDAAAVHLGDGAGFQAGRHPDVLDRRERAEQVVVLEDEPDARAERDLLGRAEARELAAEDLEPSLLDRPQGADQRQEGRLARTRRPGDDDHLAAADVDRVVEEDLRPRLARAEGVVHALGADRQLVGGDAGGREAVGVGACGVRRHGHGRSSRRSLVELRGVDRDEAAGRDAARRART